MTAFAELLKQLLRRMYLKILLLGAIFKNYDPSSLAILGNRQFFPIAKNNLFPALNRSNKL
ncbi:MULTISPECIES: hypothetical protein [Microcystis]|uniref:Uncharacterized protein n=1 Tax=Microcystis flos-aquae Mf_QC_C_20070823_S10D TaxID=2486236 RepID=A0A552L3N9_9CHRO|nr:MULTISPECIES: hypothetical protein [Microcystis]MCA2816430.1 hypothetical protein [Microcystis sp. M085S1]MCA2855955.1 hypothetical protein [Microcystis sp. M065S1]TRT95294.1 MAG: hypothetical protein EWV65_15880 [Microcystis flos-aquae Ma_QC_C_20070823_S18D]TRV14847.1 MAG: hypothetical protein EWV45_04345 [Microcystis flos-aquae Mf_QC_C_20070823_S10D]TRV28510.1 MAG: hypothetical protein EWV72_01955 [Microcystis flos-aquae Mf_QC_C_20070823_S10]TRV32694.1 MAG: hypothetical protein EWV44_190